MYALEQHHGLLCCVAGQNHDPQRWWWGRNDPHWCKTSKPCPKYHAKAFCHANATKYFAWRISSTQRYRHGILTPGFHCPSSSSLDLLHCFYFEVLTPNLPTWNPSTDPLGICMLSDNIMDYYVVSQGKTSIPGVDDGEEMTLTDVRLHLDLSLLKPNKN